MPARSLHKTDHEQCGSCWPSIPLSIFTSFARRIFDLWSPVMNGTSSFSWLVGATHRRLKAAKGNTGSVQICERLFCGLVVLFIWKKQMFMAGISCPLQSKGRLACRHAAFRKQKSLTWQLRLDQWDKQPASHSKATCLVCHFSNCAEWLPLTLKWWGNSASTCVVLQM